jgi:hypothetical protein
MRGRGVDLRLIREEELSSTLREEEPAVLLNSVDCRPLNEQAKTLAKSLFEQILSSE